VVYAEYVSPRIELAIAETPTPCIISGRDKVKPADFAACHRFIDGKHLGVMLGDSHALANFPTFRNQATAANKELALLWAPGCLPVIDFGASDRDITRGTKKCPKVMRSVMKRVAQKWTGKIEYAVLHGRWSAFTDMRGHDKKTRLEALRRNLGKTIDLLAQSGIRRILIVGPVPVFDHDARECIVHADYRGIDRDYCSAARKDVEKKQAEVKEILRVVAAEHPNVRFIDPIGVFCGAELCRPYKGDILFYKDTDHVSQMGAQRIYRTFARDFEWVTTGKESPAATTAEPTM
jgi:SGNH domain-containing protein